MAQNKPKPEFDAWNPGLESGIPRQLLPLASIFRAENISNSLQEIEELSEFSGIPEFDLAAFRPERLIAHEVVIRVSADLTVPDGPNYEDLGINMRGMVSTILDKYIEPELPSLHSAFDELNAKVTEFLTGEIGRVRRGGAVADAGEPVQKSFLARLFGQAAPKTAKAPTKSGSDHIADALPEWSRYAEDEDNGLHGDCLRCLADVANTVIGMRGRMLGDGNLLVKLAAIRVMNSHGSRHLGRLIEPIFERACLQENYRTLPVQAEPCIMNVKGASASGKSSMRSLQRELAERIGVPWEDFAVISPDYWRKFLLDYSSLDDDYKYAGALTGHELAIIDRKLDDYMDTKAEAGRMSHLLIDRFRFDSFSSESGGEAASRLLTRFGKTVFLFFVITPPEAIVERAWIRGLKTGRYKSVDDLLFHNVEAFTGMPQLFFSWAFSKVRRVHFEFLDNGVPEGERPITIASGWNRELTVFDLDGMLNIDRFKKIEIDASGPDEVYQSDVQHVVDSLGFLQQCADRLDSIEFFDPDSGKTCGIVKKGKWAWIDKKASEAATTVLSGLDAGGFETASELKSEASAPPVETEMEFNVGRLRGTDRQDRDGLVKKATRQQADF